MKLNEIKEVGFYVDQLDEQREIIYEVIENTDEEWLKEAPEQKLLIDEWIYDYTDYDDRKVYGTSGNLVTVCNNISNCKVYKIKDTKYKIYGNCGQYLIEDKPTYKEQVKQAEQKLEKIRDICKSYCERMCLCETKETCESCINTEVLQIIDEVE